MKKIYIAFLLIMPLILSANIWNIALDGSGDFSEIQMAIDLVEDGDTLLIYPGTYYENLRIINQNIQLMSLYAVTQDTSFIYSTILDGSHSSNVIDSRNSTQEFKIQGFTITNGYCYRGMENGFHQGAGINFNGITHISNCIIEHNYSENNGGGIAIMNGSLYLRGTIIRYNIAIDSGGGIIFGNDEVIFDHNELNSIYGNYSGLGTDIYNALPSDYDYDFPLQKGTSNPPNISYYCNYETGDMFNVSYEETYINETSQEVYVSPDGDNANDGSSPESPLKNIWYATLKCEGTEEEPGIIHLAPGTYASSINDEFPVTTLKSNMQLIGSGSECTILDRENQSGTFSLLWKDNIFFEGFTICNDSGEFVFYNIHFCGWMSGNGELRDIICRDIGGIAISAAYNNNIELSNVKIYNTTYIGSAIQLSSIYNTEFRNLLIEGSHYQEVEDIWHYEGGFGIGVWNGANIQEPMNYYFENVLICETDNRSPHQLYPSGSTYALGCGDEYNNVYLINSTISGNITDNHSSSVLGAVSGAHLNIYNSVIYDNFYHSLMIGGYASVGESYIGVTHSLVEGGFEDMVDVGGYWTAEWLEGNLDIDEDPEFCGVGQSEFMLQQDSPCLDSGSLTCLPEGYELSETDMAGNPRVYGDNIDMGCYEWQGTECDFSWEQDENSVSFTAFSNEDIYQIEWDFECDGEIDSNVLNPVHVYTANGTYSVGVSINNGRGGRKYENCLTIENVGNDNELIIDNGQLMIRNYPNPFNPRTTIEFELPAKGEVTLTIYDIKGRKVKAMLNAVLEAGTHSFIWNGKNEQEIDVASGVYFYELTWNDRKIREKINLLK
ncbi:MAG: T9SS type A sorting domain-containing protein [Candidatus Cloacimonetes bacterium]|nr:T9SS type A sorting domain-containing protein [Candidatus Cloacimonadota bacterium]